MSPQSFILRLALQQSLARVSNDRPERHATPATLKFGQSVPITATLNGVTQTFMVTVGAPTLIGITVQPAPAAVPAGR